MKKLKKILISFSLCMMLILPGVIPAKANITPYQAMLDNLQALETYAKAYKVQNASETKSVDQLVLIYIRSGRYDDLYWKMLAGTRTPGFETYVAAQDAANSTQSASLKSIGNITLPNGEITDAMHMFAAMNLTITPGTPSADLGGWAGDLTDLITDIKDTPGDLASLTELAKSKLGQSGGFGKADVIADLDAVNIMSIRSQDNTVSYKTIMENYFNQVTETNRVKDFVANRFSGLTLTKEAYEAKIYETYTENTLITTLETQRGISPTTHAEHRRAATIAFADYLYEIMSYVPVASVEITNQETTLDKDQTMQLVVEVLPINATNTEVSWESSDPTIATVSDTGLVTAIAKGVVRIEVTALDNNGTGFIDLTITDIKEDAKTAAKAELEAKSMAVKEAIDALTGLTDAEKTVAKNAINVELTRGSNAIDATAIITKVTEEKTTSIDNMDNILVEAQKVSDERNYVAPISGKPLNSGTDTKPLGNVKTGDSSNAIGFGLLFLGAGSLLIGIGQRRKRRQY